MNRFLKTGVVVVFLLLAEVPASAGGSSAQILLPKHQLWTSQKKFGRSRPDVPASGTSALLPVLFRKQPIRLQYVSRGLSRVFGSRPEFGRKFHPSSASACFSIYSEEKGSSRNFRCYSEKCITVR
jgi:hypothetical protein